MKKILLTLSAIVLAGCQTTLPENSQDNEISYSTKTKILEVKQKETSKDKPGEYPLQYRYIISNYTNSPNFILFKPILYSTTNNEKGWGTCAKVNNKSEIFIIKNNQVIEQFNSPNLKTVCDSLKITQEKHDDEHFSKNMEKAVEKFKIVVDDETQSHLFGPPPDNPEKMILSQLSLFIQNPDKAKLEDLSVRKTFFLLNDETIYSYLIFANLITFNNQGIQQETKKSIFYYKNGVILNHKIFHEETATKKGEILKNMFDEDTDTFETDSEIPQSTVNTTPRTRTKVTISNSKNQSKSKPLTSKNKNNIKKTEIKPTPKKK